MPFQDFVTISKGATIHEIPPRAALDPFQEAEKATRVTGGGNTCVFMPGRAFDTFGTRFGQGGGWYDRFLSNIPSTWTRVGFCFDTQFSKEPLVRQSWDQAMDFVCVVDRDKGTADIHETKARAMLDLKS